MGVESESEYGFRSVAINHTNVYISTVARELAKITFRRLVFDARVVTPMLLPHFKGATLRGGFGRALLDLCLRRKRIDIYRYIFETPIKPGSERLASCEEAPRPYVIEPPLEARTAYAPGDSIRFSVLLVGDAADYVSWVVDAFELLGQERGLGRAIYPAGRGRFELEAVRLLPGRLNSSAPESAASPVSEEARISRLAIDFITPLRMVADERFATEPQFHVLIRNLLRRASNLAYFHCGSQLDLDFRGIVQAARNAKLSGDSSTWMDWERYSYRQGERLKLGGLVGWAEYEGNLRSFIPLLRFGEQLHVGKGVVFGLGLYGVGAKASNSEGKAKGENNTQRAEKEVVTEVE